MELQDVIRRRRMVRRYSPEPVPGPVLDRLLENAVRAPSAGFSQGWAFLVLDAPDDVARFWDATTPAARAEQPGRWLRGMRTAPVVIVPLSCEEAYRERYAEPDKALSGRVLTGTALLDDASDPPPPGRPAQEWPVPYWHVDTGMAALLILQTAVDEGFGACFFGIPAERLGSFRRAFGVPESHTPIGAITVGRPVAGDRPTGSPTTRRRRTLDEVVHRGHWAEAPTDDGPRAGASSRSRPMSRS